MHTIIDPITISFWVKIGVKIVLYFHKKYYWIWCVSTEFFFLEISIISIATYTEISKIITEFYTFGPWLK